MRSVGGGDGAGAGEEDGVERERERRCCVTRRDWMLRE